MTPGSDVWFREFFSDYICRCQKHYTTLRQTPHTVLFELHELGIFHYCMELAPIVCHSLYINLTTINSEELSIVRGTFCNRYGEEFMVIRFTAMVSVNISQLGVLYNIVSFIVQSSHHLLLNKGNMNQTKNDIIQVKNVFPCMLCIEAFKFINVWTNQLLSRNNSLFQKYLSPISSNGNLTNYPMSIYVHCIFTAGL